MGFWQYAEHICKTDLYFFVFRVMGIGVVDILDVDVFGGALMLLSAWMLTPAALMLLLALRVMLLPLSVELTAVFLILPSKSSVEV
ncbi:hypothetical protein BSPWISOXPB_3475 [uncultured Gammaproteobacteria bacterium]|nr:hypothetical protein BSPWISOXPB_3475 [uncultured Gammaproteobacteria bacterium]